MSNAARLAIVGAPRTGKSTLARTLGRSLMVPIRSTDEVMGLGWSEASEASSKWFSEPGGFVIEGVAVVRAIRKWLKANPVGKPCDELLVLTETFEPLSKGQAAMGKGVHTVLAEIRPELERRGVRVTVGAAPVPESGITRRAS